MSNNMALDFTGKRALVTAASKGIGRSVVELLAGLGATVFFTYRHRDDSVESLSTIATGIQANACDQSSYMHLAQQVGNLDILVNNAGDVLRRSSFKDSDDALWTASLDINLQSAVRASRTFLPVLEKSAAAVIVNVSSIAAENGGAGDSMHYGVAKAAMNAFTKALAKEVPGTIRVVGVGPSAIDTNFQTKHSSQARLDKIINSTPAGRIGTPQEVAEMIVFLASDRCGFVSGETVLMTGGR